MKPLVIIPARGGSKGIPRKNVRPLGGKPLIGWSIDVAREFLGRHGLDDSRILLSTDDAGIASAARAMELEVPYMRPEELATDTAGSREVMLDAMDWADSQGMEYDCVVLLQPTSPFRSADDVERTVALFYDEQPDMAVTVKEASANPYYNCFEADPATGALHVSKGSGLLTRRQDAPSAWEFNGAVYAIAPASLRAMPMGAFPRRLGVEMPPERSVDLDTMLDWAVAEALLSSQLL